MERFFPGLLLFRENIFLLDRRRNIFHGIPPFPALLLLVFSLSRIAGNAGGTNVCFRGNKSFFRTKSKEVVSREDGQSGERKIGAAICSENRPFLPAFPFKKRSLLPLVSQHRVSFQDLPLSSFLPLNYRGRKLRVRRGKLLFRRKVKDPLRVILHFTRITLDSDESDRKTVSKISSVHHR